MNRPSELDRDLERDLKTMTGSRISRRTALAALIAPAAALLLAACGDNTKVRDSSPTTSSTTAGSSDNSTATTAPADTTATTAPVGTTATTATQNTTQETTQGTTQETTPETIVAGGIEHPTGADEVILRYGYVGGFVPAGYAFTNVPNVLITGDGRLIQPGVTTQQYPGQLLPALEVRSISEAGIQKILAAADASNLLAPPPDYSAEVNVADAADTQVVLNAKGESFLHQAPALGYQDPAETKVRIALHDFTIGLDDIETFVGKENLGEARPFEATIYRFQARPLTAEDLAGYTDEPKPTQVPWPSDIGVTLASAAECAEVDAAAVGTLFGDANQLTFFVEDGTTYMVSAVAMLPGDSC